MSKKGSFVKDVAAGPNRSIGAPSDLGRVFSAMADPTRRAILTRLAEGSATVGELAEPFEMSLPAVSKHLKVLERAGLLEREIVGRVHHCRAVLEPLQEAERWIAQREAFWDRGLESLRSFLDSSPAAPSSEQAAKTPEQAAEGGATEITSDRALAIVRRNPDGTWRIERLLEPLEEPPAVRRETQTRR